MPQVLPILSTHPNGNSVFLETHSEPVFSLDDFTSSPISLITVVTYTIQKRNNATKKLLKVKVELSSLLIVIDRDGNLFNFDLSENPHIPVKKEQLKNTTIQGKVIAAKYHAFFPIAEIHGNY